MSICWKVESLLCYVGIFVEIALQLHSVLILFLLPMNFKFNSHHRTFRFQ